MSDGLLLNPHDSIETAWDQGRLDLCESGGGGLRACFSRSSMESTIEAGPLEPSAAIQSGNATDCVSRDRFSYCISSWPFEGALKVHTADQKALAV